MAFFQKRHSQNTQHLSLAAAKRREDIRIEKGIAIPADNTKRKASADEWDAFWTTVEVGDSFVLTESFAQTVRASANKRGIVTRVQSVGPFKVRLWRAS